MPKTILGKWSVGLNAFFLVTVATSCVLVLILKILNFDDRWWDVTVAIVFPASIIALIVGIIAVKKISRQLYFGSPVYSFRVVCYAFYYIS